MDANKFMTEYKRMCANYDRCSDCPLGKGKRICSYYPSLHTQEMISATIKTVEEWSAAHPLKTRQSVFLKQYPNAVLDKDGVLRICPSFVGGDVSEKYRCLCSTDCGACRREFWMHEGGVK